MRPILVTGANKGIGLAIIRGILSEQDDTFAILGSRSRTRGELARTELLTAHPEWGPRLEVVELDVTDDASVQRAVRAVTQRFPTATQPLAALVNNAGVASPAPADTILEVNIRGLRRVSEAFLPLIQPGGRVVNLTSASGPMFVETCAPEQQRFLVDKTVDPATLEAFLQRYEAGHHEGLGNPEDAYGLSKAAANTYTRWLAAQHPGLQINACTPGFIATDLTQPFADAAGVSPTQMGMKQPADGARSPLHLLFADVQGTGNYYGSDAVRSPFDRYRSAGDPPYTGE